jgi:hypothetical protein
MELDVLQGEGVVQVDDRWAIEVAAMVSQLGCIGVPEAVLERAYGGKELNAEEREHMARIPELTRSFLAHIPRLEPVLELLSWQQKPPRAVRDGPIGARVLGVALAFDARVARGESPQQALAAFVGHERDYDPRVLAALAEHSGEPSKGTTMVIALGSVERGMVFAEDVRLPSGALLAADGFEVTDSFAQRARGFDRQLRSTLVTVAVV